MNACKFGDVTEWAGEVLGWDGMTYICAESKQQAHHEIRNEC